MNITNMNANMPKAASVGTHDVLVGTLLQKNMELKMVMVGSSSDLTNLTALYAPGTIAYTAGFGTVWQLSAAGSWTEVE